MLLKQIRKQWKESYLPCYVYERYGKKCKTSFNILSKIAESYDEYDVVNSHLWFVDSKLFVIVVIRDFKKSKEDKYR